MEFKDAPDTLLFLYGLGIAVSIFSVGAIIVTLLF